MNKKDLARRLAKESHRSQAQAADEVDKFVHRILMDLKRYSQKSRDSSEKAVPGANAKEQA